MTKSVGMLSHMPESQLKRLPRNVVFGIEGSEFLLKGRVDWSQMTIEESATLTRTHSISDTFEGRLDQKWFPGLPSEITFAVASEADQWEITLTGINYHTFKAQDLRVQRADGKFWGYMMAHESDQIKSDYELVFARAWGYLAPIFRDVKGSKPETIHGRRPIVIETAGPGGYIGAVVPSVRFSGKWEILVQDAKNVSPDLTPIATKRAVRFSVQNPDKPQPRENAVGFSLWEVDLYPELIASGRYAEKGRVKNLYYLCHPEFQAPENQQFVEIAEYLRFADTPGMAALFQAIVQKFSAYLGDIEGTNNEAADVKVDLSDSYGKPIRIGVIKGKTTWMVICRDAHEGRFSRDGVPISATDASDFDPATVNSTPKIHKFYAVNPNNQRHTGSSTTAGLYPVEVYEYEHDFGTTGLNLQTLCDFTKSGDAKAQSGLMQWLWHKYAPVFSTMDPDVVS